LILAAFLILALRSPRRRLYLFCGAWIGITLAPMLLLHSVYHMVQDYYLYLPSVGSSLLLGDLLAVLSRKNADSRRLAVGCSIAMLVVYTLTLWQVQRYWHDDVTAAKAYVEGCPVSTAWHLTLGMYLERAGDLAQAENEVRIALSLEPDRTGTIHPNSIELDQILGEIMAKRGNVAGAELQLRKSMNESNEHQDQTSPDRRAYVKKTFLLYDQGVGDKASGRVNQAIPEITEALDKMTSFPTPEFFPISLHYIPLVEIYDSQGDSARVKSLLEKLEYMPEGELAVGLARAEIMLNHNDKRGAEHILLELADKYPNNPQVLIRLGGVQADLNENDQALNSYQRISHWIAHPRVYASMAKSLHAMGRDREALDQCRLALALASPHDLETLFVCTQIQYSVDNK
jgi:tetratricopeptide (TPR) repeat protein